MFDNDLLRNYKHTLTRTGILDLGNTQDFSYSHLERGVWKMYGKDKLYYAKAVNKSRMDAEVILSRAAKLIDLKTATYYAMQNPNFDDPTLTKEDIIRGYEIIKDASKELGIPIRAIGVAEKLKEQFDSTYDGVEVWFYERMMPDALW